MTVENASRQGCVANCLRKFGRIHSVENAGRVSAREPVAREVLGEPCLVFRACFHSAISRMAHEVRPARDLRSFDATTPVLRRMIGNCARLTTVSRVQGEHLERAETRKVADWAIGFCPTEFQLGNVDLGPVMPTGTHCEQPGRRV